ncbi:hypothetical protein PRZ48_013559 [Zasmidium cellare]|uniref:Uncharacterized protein n=1 Tax=Zasmidium cellare TaxID=395010 RepID=A0ABR0E1D8_ZASCE|nr:hypothetical protein PRZ48_013559 [Zasmidium cellare]
MEQPQKSKNPLHGPPMAPSVFATKWLAKFRDYLLYNYSNPYYKADEPRTCVLSEEGFDLLSNFHAQAAELNLTMSKNNFPDEVIPNDARPGDIRNPPGIATLNPFSAAQTLQFMLDAMVQKLEGMKTQGKTVEGMRWQEMPLRWRQRMDELFVKVDQARKTGWYTCPKMEWIDEMLWAGVEAAKKGTGVSVQMDKERKWRVVE